MQTLSPDTFADTFARVTGGAARAYDEAERITRLVMKELGMPAKRGGLEGRGTYQDEKAMLAWLLRKMSPVSRDWVAERLCMGHPTSVSRAAVRVRTEKALIRKAVRLEKLSLQQISVRPL